MNLLLGKQSIQTFLRTADAPGDTMGKKRADGYDVHFRRSTDDTLSTSVPIRSVSENVGVNPPRLPAS